MLPEAVIELLRAEGCAPTDLRATVGGFSHHSAQATIDEQPCVIKAASLPIKRADVWHEARILNALADTSIPAPRLIAFCETAEWSVEVLAWLPGNNGLQILAAPEPPLAAMVAALGRILAQVHATPLAPLDPHAQIAERVSKVRESLDSLPLSDEVHSAFQQALAQPAWHAPTRSLLHGDAGLHNLLWHEHRASGLLDWEWAAWGDPQLDLAWVWWTMRWRNLPTELWQHFLDSYAATQPLPNVSVAALHTLALGHIAAMLVRVHGQTAAWQEWLRRADWTLALANEI